MASEDSSNITQWLNEWMTGSDEAFDQIYPQIAGQLRKTARNRKWQIGLQNALMTDEVLAFFFIELMKKRKHGELHFNSRNEFMAYYAEVVKGLVINEARKIKAQKRGGNTVNVALSEADQASQDNDTERERISIIDMEKKLDLLYKRDPKAWKYFIEWYFGGFEQKEIAANHEVDRRSVMRRIEFAKAVIKE